MRDNPIVITQEFKASVDRVWTAITDKDQMTKWFFEMIPDFEPRVGFETSFKIHFEGNDYLHVWQVLEVIPTQKLVYSWKYGGYPGSSFVVWELTTNEDQTILHFSHHGQESFPQENPAFTRESCLQGWVFFINERLKEYLNTVE
ncbi:SRPBCC domain-containing protein [Parabacteroides sp. PF5-9]|uniref:SRPBCC family protein n=1 Tax=Parabacteroides sp. PF5-9 TaxID=1742404 RepID=UPI002472F4B7|nr:SRPBCC domain-containing protein [Parabacteroides sp. PF5-9]MDH6358158.1 uncharacterized protein YndB with AHSA1/START domain [Parabacteroides sp. PF5-9]